LEAGGDSLAESLDNDSQYLAAFEEGVIYKEAAALKRLPFLLSHT
jgi:hypothetical protein